MAVVAGRTTPPVYVRQVIAELRKTTWPSRPDLVRSAWITVAFTTATVGVLTAADTGLGKLMVAAFGG